MTPPDLDDPCGERFVYRDLVACGETYARLSAERGAPFDNLPRAEGTWAAIRTLCKEVLDPVAARFGRENVEITYGFASPRLTRHVAGLIHPPGDQHAGHEVNTGGNLVCKRLGLAVDFRVRGVDSREVALWVVENTAYDRLYVYAPDRPIHVSAGPDGTRQIVKMVRGPSGRLIPRVIPPRSLRG
jgi:hypothetical protein